MNPDDYLFRSFIFVLATFVCTEVLLRFVEVVAFRRSRALDPAASSVLRAYVGWGDRRAVRFAFGGLIFAYAMSIAHALDLGGAMAASATTSGVLTFAITERRSSVRIRERLGLGPLGAVDRRVDDAARSQFLAWIAAALAGLCLGAGELIAGVALASIAIGARTFVSRFAASPAIRRDARLDAAVSEMEARAIGNFEPMCVVDGARPIVRSIGNLTYLGSAFLDDADDDDVRSLVERERRPTGGGGSWGFLGGLTAGAALFGAMIVLLGSKFVTSTGGLSVLLMMGIGRQRRTPSATLSPSERRFFESEHDLEPLPRYPIQGPKVSLDAYGKSLDAPRRDAIEQVALVVGSAIVVVPYFVLTMATLRPGFADRIVRVLGI